MSEADFGELDALRSAGILTDAEYDEALDKMRSRQVDEPADAAVDVPVDLPVDVPVDLPVDPDAVDTDVLPVAGAHSAPRHAVPAHGAAAAVPRHAAPRGRHAKPPKRWPWIAASIPVVGAAVAVGILLRPATHHHPSHVAAPPSQSSAHAAPIVVASPANTPMAINLDGANARVAVSQLTAAPAAGTPSMTTYTATVTVSGTSGSFTLDPSEFSAHSLTGQNYPVSTTGLTTLRPTTVGAGQRTSGEIAFTVPKTEHIAVVLFTTHLGEQLGLWSTS